MSGLRESKKAATRSALARAAAETALREGSEGLTVAAITQAAGVSQRTFHNYFSSREEAVEEFLRESIQALVVKIGEVPAELDLAAAVEQLVISNLYAEDGELESFATLFRLSEILDNFGTRRRSERSEINKTLDPLFPIIESRISGLSAFEATVYVRAIAEAMATALQWHYTASPEPRDPAEAEKLVRQAIAMLRRI